MQPLSGNQRPNLLTSLMSMSLVLRLPREMHLWRSSWTVPRLPSFLDMLENPYVLLQNHIWTFKSGPSMWCFVHFDLDMCFAPQRRALLRHRNFQKCSEPGVFCTFWLRNVLCATTACTFSTSQLPKVVRTWCVLYILTCKCASRRIGVQFFISHLASWLHTRRFSEPTFRPSGAWNHWKNHSESRLFYLFAHLHLLSSDSFSSLIFFLLLFSSLLSLFPLLFHLSLPYCRKFEF